MPTTTTPPSSAATRPSDVPLGRRRDFNIFIGGQFISYVGDTAALIAIPLLVLDITGSVGQMGLVTGVGGVGKLIGGIVAGRLADQVDRRRLMIVCDVVRFVLFGALPLLWWIGLTHVGVLYGVAFGGGAMASCFMITQLAAVPSLVPMDQLTAANGRLMAAYGVALFIGPLIAGALCASIGAAPTLGLDALTFVVSAISLLVIRFHPPARDDASQAHIPAVKQRFIGIRYMWREPTLRWVLILVATTSMMLIGVHDLLIFRLKNDLGHGDETIGVVLGVAAIGAILGGALAATARSRLGFGGAFLGALLVQGACFSLIGASATAYGVAGAAMGFAFANSSRRVYSISIRQELTPDLLLGRVTAALFIVLASMEPFGAAGAGLLADRFGARPVLVAIGVLAASIGLLGYFTPARASRPQRHPIAAQPDP